MGIMKKITIFLVLLLLTGFSYAQQISFQIVQHDISADYVTEQTYMIEDQLVDMFFENGYIVTNSPTVYAERESDDEKFWNDGLRDAYDGYSDYFVQIKLYYTMERKTNKGGATLKKADWVLVYAPTAQEIVKSTVKSKESKDLSDDVFFMSSDIFNAIKKAIKA